MNGQFQFPYLSNYRMSLKRLDVLNACISTACPLPFFLVGQLVMFDDAGF